MENRRVLKKEGLNLTIDKEVLDDQRVLEVSTEVPDKAKVEKEDKDDFENYKVLYKGAIDDRCLEEYGTCDDEKLWEDTAKEMFLKAVNYIPEDNKKADGELVDREEEQEPTLVRENRSVIKHTKVVESKKLNEDIETNISVEKSELSENRMEDLMSKMLDFIKENDYENHYFEDLAQNGMYSRMRIFGGLSDKFYDYVQAYEQVISAMAYANKTDYVTDLLKYDKEILNLSNEECPLVTTNLTVRKEIANKLGVNDIAATTTNIEESKNNTNIKECPKQD